MKQFDNTTPHLSAVYDSQIGNTIPYYECFHQETMNIVKAAGFEPKIWLDTGAGTGTLVRKCAEVFPDTIFLLADPSEDMLLEAKKKFTQEELCRIRFLEPVDTEKLELKKEKKADVITAIQSHHYLSPEKRKKATRVCFDLLRKDGIFITFENTRPFSEKGIEIGKSCWSSYQMAQGKSMEQVKAHMERFGTEYFPITIEEHMALYRECGFQTVELFWFSYMQAGFYCMK